MDVSWTLWWKRIQIFMEVMRKLTENELTGVSFVDELVFLIETIIGDLSLFLGWLYFFFFMSIGLIFISLWLIKNIFCMQKLYQKTKKGIFSRLLQNKEMHNKIRFVRICFEFVIFYFHLRMLELILLYFDNQQKIYFGNSIIEKKSAVSLTLVR